MKKVFVLASLALVLVLSPAHAGVKERLYPGDIPPQVKDGILNQFPDAQIGSASRERIKGVVTYEVNFTNGKDKLKANVTGNGEVHKVESAKGKKKKK